MFFNYYHNFKGKVASALRFITKTSYLSPPKKEGQSRSSSLAAVRAIHVSLNELSFGESNT